MDIYGCDYEHTLDISSFRQGLQLNYHATDRNELFAKVLEAREFDVCEFSLSNYIMMRDRGVDWLTAIPVFPSRGFRHSILLVRKDDDHLTHPSDLIGKRIGIADYTMTGGVWGRGILAEFYRLHWSEVEWFSTGHQRFEAPPGVNLKVIDGDLEVALADGRLDALLSPRTRDSARPWSDRKFRPILTDWKEAELNYFRSTGIYPISHTVVIPLKKIDSHPLLPSAVMAAYGHSMGRAKERRIGSTFLPWADSTWPDTMGIFASDPMPYGLNPGNEAVIGKLQEYLVEQKLIGRYHSCSDLFWQDS
ncbi:hypothetical protein GCM10007276_28630 [Agaricicola taiwanensis]|uniref:4,5-dihydroxyphthalate decarboxylase n=1 Tax=Agaricicola taiwanensis TaxID=591372 RepID=A0A8J2YL19_9RHOB|nr:hypothetical protein [Agaricicola taiwanensis]GGE49762.1 hypothetical protein GCM10007276_28630 [Agaricicola taiwanensis]